jgi:hypothetical protein
MQAVREFRREDLQRVADLWVKVFLRREGPASRALRDYFQEIFLEGPRADPDLVSLVYEDARWGIVGFLGVIPRRMRLHGRSIRVAVATQLMTAHDVTYAGARLMRRLFAGNQDLTLSDGANEHSEKLWRAAGGEVALLHCLEWTRVLRPASFLFSRLQRHLVALARPAQPLCLALDAAINWSRLGHYWLPAAAGTLLDEEPTDDVLFQCVLSYHTGNALQPEYDSVSFGRLLKSAGEKAYHGTLRKGIVRSALDGTAAGWFLYYVRPGGIAQVLQFGGAAKSIEKVLNHLFHDAWRQGAMAISGRLDSRFAKELARCRCRLGLPGYAVLIHSRNPEILAAIHRGDAVLTRLDGEWWARFSDPSWAVDGLPSLASDKKAAALNRISGFDVAS